jgi:hypothetical protein
MSILSKQSQLLLSDGTYKSIVDIQENDKIMNMWMEPISIKKKLTVTHNMTQIHYNNWYEPLYCSVSTKLITNNLEKDIEKIQWTSIDNIHENTLLYTNKNNTIFPDDFKFEYTDDLILEPTYNLGFIYGMYAGFGNIIDNQVEFLFGPNDNLVDIIKNTMKDILQVDVNVEKVNNNNKITCNDENLVNLFKEFSSKIDKNIPYKFLCNNVNYLQGIFDGLIDYDDSTKTSRFITTSEKLAQTFILLCNILDLSCENTVNKIKSINMYLLTVKYEKQNCFGQIHKIVKDSLDTEGYILFTDCPTQSVVVNNIIVHL